MKPVAFQRTINFEKSIVWSVVVFCTAIGFSFMYEIFTFYFIKSYSFLRFLTFICIYGFFSLIISLIFRKFLNSIFSRNKIPSRTSVITGTSVAVSIFLIVISCLTGGMLSSQDAKIKNTEIAKQEFLEKRQKIVANDIRMASEKAAIAIKIASAKEDEIERIRFQGLSEKQRTAEKLHILKIMQMPRSQFTSISFNTSINELISKFPTVQCKQMPNPIVKMCRLSLIEANEVTYLYYDGKLINIDGRVRD